MKSTVLVVVAMGLLFTSAAAASLSDKQPPVITITTPAANASFDVNQVVTARYFCSDNRRLKSCVGTVTNGAKIATSAVGDFTFTVTATDQAGNVATKSVKYTVSGTSPFPPMACQSYYGLTFDDGPNPLYTQPILTTLLANQAPATFFEVGKNIAAYKDITKRLADNGYSIQNHTYTHPDLTTLPDEKVSTELTQTGNLIQNVTGKAPQFARPPYGEVNASVLATFGQLGLEDTLWTTDTKDWDGRSAAQILEAALWVPPGGIILMHDAYPNTVQALPQIIQQLRAKGFCPGRLAKSTKAYPDWYDVKYYVEAVQP